MNHILSVIVASTLAIGATVGGMESPDKEVARCNLPPQFHIKNQGGIDGAGLCVFASIDHTAKWQDVKEIQGIFQWMRNHPGGGWPKKVDMMIDKLCKERGVDKPKYIQVEGSDIDIIEKAVASGRMVSATYYYSPSGRYGGQRISHMVSIVHFDKKWVGILDNNYPNTIEWLTHEEFEQCYKNDYGQGWCVVFLQPGPPPPPKN